VKCLELIEEEDFNFLISRLSEKRPGFIKKVRYITFLALEAIIVFMVFSCYQFSLNIFLFLVLLTIGSYKIYYVYLKCQYIFKCKEIKKVASFYFKHLSYLLNIYPVNVALYESLEYAPKDMINDLEQLLNDSMNSPNDFLPYDHFIYLYNYIENIDYYMHTIYTLRDIKEECEGRKILQGLTSNITLQTIESRKVVTSGIVDSLQIIVSFPVLVLGYLIFNLLTRYIDVML